MVGKECVGGLLLVLLPLRSNTFILFIAQQMNKQNEDVNATCCVRRTGQKQISALKVGLRCYVDLRISTERNRH